MDHKLPNIRRARGYRLYDFSGKRYIDLHQQGGGAILGHRGGGMLKEVKNVLSRGLSASLPSEHAGRLEKSLRRLLPAYGSVRFFSCIHACLEAVSVFLGERIDPADIFDPAFGLPYEGQPVSYWRPFLPGSSEGSPWVLLPIMPFVGVNGFCAACFRMSPGDELPSSENVPPHLVAGALRGIGDLAAFSRADKALVRALEGARDWRLTGPYIVPLCDRKAYGEVFGSFLEAGVLLSPAYPGPSILPAETSPGEAGLLKGLFAPQGV